MEYPSRFVAATEAFATHEVPIPAPIFRGHFLWKQGTKTEVVICGLGLYRVFCNGRELTRGYLSGCPVNPDQILCYETYDITPVVRQGDNVLAVLLGNGMLNCIGGMQWGFDLAAFRSAPKTAFAVLVDGKEIYSSAEPVKVHPSAILYDDLREGESYDARREIGPWWETAFDDRNWDTAIAAQTPKGLCMPNYAPPVVPDGEYACIGVRKVQDGHLFEFPLNTAGFCRLRIRAVEGQRITMQYVEAVDAQNRPFTGNLVFGCTGRIQFDEYICKEGWQTYVPSFTYHGFRYVYVTGLTEEQAVPETLTMMRLHADLKRTGMLQTSDRIVNGILSMIDNSNLSNLVHFPTDCPQREKCGFSGDVAMSVRQMGMQYDIQGIIRQWLTIHRLSQREDGAMPGLAPTVDDSGYEIWTGPSWTMGMYRAVLELYRLFGNTQCIREIAEAMERYIFYLLQQKNADGLIAFGLGDWCQTSLYYADRYTTPNEITDSLAGVEILEITGFVLGEIQLPLRMNYRAEAQNLREAFAKKWLTDTACKCESQTAQALCLHYGLFAPEKVPAAAEELVRRIQRDGNVMDVGILGGYVLFDVLSENGYTDLAYRLITQTKAPSYGYFANRGETSLRESLIGHGQSRDDTRLYDGNTINSLNHHFWGFVYDWLTRHITGLSINETYKNPNSGRLRIPDAETDEVTYLYRFPCGTLRLHWAKHNAVRRLQLTVPQGAEIILDLGAERRSLTAGEYDMNL